MSAPFYRPIFARATLFALAVGMSGPFLTLYAISLGADSVDLGFLQAAINVVPNVLQLPFGRLTDRWGRRKLILYIGSTIYFVVFVPVIFVYTPKEYVLLLSIQSVANAMMTPAFLSLIGDATTVENRAGTMAKLNLLNGVGSLIATLFTSMSVFFLFGTSRSGYQFMFLASLAFGVIATISIHFIREPKQKSIKESMHPFTDLLKITKTSPLYSQFLFISTLYGFFMSLMWPLAGLTLAKVHNAGTLEFGMIQISAMVSYIVSQNVFRHIFDRAGRVPVLVFSRFGLIVYPLMYAFSPNVYWLYLANLIGGVFSALADTAILAYLFDSTPSGQRGVYTSLYNLSTGMSYFAGSVVGGALSAAGTPYFGLIPTLQYVYVVSIFGRGALAIMHQKLIETKKAETNLRQALFEELHLSPTRKPEKPGAR
ncbi:MAG: MFS transporter [Nitrososphaeria archaeon]